MTAPNPYEPPRAEAEPAAAVPEVSGRQLASRSRRFFGAVIDTLFAVPIASGLSYAYAAITGEARTSLMVQACMFVPFTIQWLLVSTRGQSIGKMLMRTRIVMVDGRLPGFVHGVALRVWPVLAIQYLPALVPAATSSALSAVATLIALADGLAIFGAEHRCIHDRMAGTYVVDTR